MKKRYRKPKVKNGQMILQKGKIDGEVDMCLFFGDDVPRPDRSLIFYYLTVDNINYRGGEIKSLIKQLDERGYDLDTLKFSIEKKKIANP